MRIGIYDPYLDTLSGGEKYMLAAALCLQKNHSVSIFWDGDEESMRKRVLQKFGYRFDNISFTENIFSSKYPLLKRFLKSRSFDAIIMLSDGSIPFLGCDLYLHFQSPMEWLHTTSIKEKIKIRRVKGFLCNSQYTKSFIDKKFQVRSVVLYPLIDQPVPGVQKKENIILNVGRFGIETAGSSFKKQDVMVHVFQELEKELKEWKFVLIVSTVNRGEKALLDTLKKRVERSAVEVIENPDNDTLQRYYKKAKIYWHAAGYGEDTHTHPDRAEHFGMATVEAMGYRAVPIVINKGGQKEIVTQSKDGYLWETLDELKKYTISVALNARLMESLSSEARKKAETFQTAYFCKKLSEIIS